MKYHTTSKQEQLIPNDTTKNLLICGEKDLDATHVITEVTYGFNAFLMFEKAYEAVDTYIIDGINYREVSMSNGNKYQGIVSSLAAFWPALQVLKGDIDGGKRTFEGFYDLWTQYNAMPDLYNLDSGKLLQYGRDWPLRPELVESAYHLYTATRDIKYIKVGLQL